MKEALDTLFDFEHILTPIAIEHQKSGTTASIRTFRLVYIFGVRVAFWATTKFEGQG